jgi:hypothetical protein
MTSEQGSDRTSMISESPALSSTPGSNKTEVKDNDIEQHLAGLPQQYREEILRQYSGISQMY